MRRAKEPENVVHVELLEADDDDATAPGDHDRPGRRRDLWWVGVGVLAALVLAGVAANVAEARQEAARRAALAQIPWLMPRIDGPLQEAWRAPGNALVAQTSDLIITQASYDGGALVAVDESSGEVAWEYPAQDDESCSVVGKDGAGADVSVDGLTAADAQMILCGTWDWFAQPGLPDAGLAWTVRGLDVQTGEVLSDVQGEGRLLTAETIDRDVVVAAVQPDGSVFASRTVLRGGANVWTYQGVPGQVDAAWSVAAWLAAGGTLRVEGVVNGASIVLSSGTGEEVPDASAEVQETHFTVAPSAELPDGGRVETTLGDGGGSVVGGRVVDMDGTTRFEFDGAPWLVAQLNYYGVADVPVPTDGSAPDVLVVQEDIGSLGGPVRLVGLDVATGEELWALDFEHDGYLSSQPLFQIDGHVLAKDSTTAWMIDVRTGQKLWELDADQHAKLGWGLTDGYVALVLMRRDGEEWLAGLDLRTGREKWSVLAPEGAQYLVTADSGLILMQTDTELIAYR